MHWRELLLDLVLLVELVLLDAKNSMMDWLVDCG